MSLEQLERTLRLDTKAALGCTEPATIALATCKARHGVLGENLESSLANIGLIAAPGMIETDDQILAIMLGKPITR